MNIELELSVGDTALLMGGFVSRIQMNLESFEKARKTGQATPEIEAVHLERVLLAAYGLKFLTDHAVLNNDPVFKKIVDEFGQLQEMLVPTIDESVRRMGELVTIMARREIEGIVNRPADA